MCGIVAYIGPKDATPFLLEGLARLEDVVAEHLLRFAFREPVKRLGWTRAWEAGRIDPPALRINGGVSL